MRYEHKTVGVSWFEALEWVQGPIAVTSDGEELGHRPNTNLGKADEWHVVGVIPGPMGDPNGKVFFMLERVVNEEPESGRS